MGKPPKYSRQDLLDEIDDVMAAARKMRDHRVVASLLSLKAKATGLFDEEQNRQVGSFTIVISGIDCPPAAPTLPQPVDTAHSVPIDPFGD